MIQEESAIRDRFRIRFTKTGLLRWIGHHDLQRLWERCLRRCGVKLSMSEGFHTRVRMNFPSALALGVEGLEEVVEVELAEDISEEQLRLKLEQDNQPGLTIVDVKLVFTMRESVSPAATLPKMPKAKLHSCEYEIEIPEGFDREQVDRSIALALTLDEIVIERKQKRISVVRAVAFPVIRRDDKYLCVSQIEQPGPSVKITELLDVIGLVVLLPCGAVIRRTCVRLVDEVSPRHSLINPEPCLLFSLKPKAEFEEQSQT